MQNLVISPHTELVLSPGPKLLFLANVIIFPAYLSLSLSPLFY